MLYTLPVMRQAPSEPHPKIRPYHNSPSIPTLFGDIVANRQIRPYVFMMLGSPESFADLMGILAVNGLLRAVRQERLKWVRDIEPDGDAR
jgi:hypothetical protein